MTSGFRLLAALSLAALALLMGLSHNTRRTASEIDRETRIVSELDPWTAEEVDALVARIVDAGLYPDALLLSDEGENPDGDIGMTEVEAAFIDPSLRALVGSGGDWTLIIRRDDQESRTLRLGDILADDWQVTSISATSVTFERGDETRRLDAYPSREG